MLIRCDERNAVYLLEEGTKRWVSDLDRARAEGINVEDINTIPTQDLEATPIGPPLFQGDFAASAGLLMRNTNGDVWAVGRDRQRHRIFGGDTIEREFGSLAGLIDLPQDVINSVPEGKLFRADTYLQFDTSLSESGAKRMYTSVAIDWEQNHLTATTSAHSGIMFAGFHGRAKLMLLGHDGKTLKVMTAPQPVWASGVWFGGDGPPLTWLSREDPGLDLKNEAAEMAVLQYWDPHPMPFDDIVATGKTIIEIVLTIVQMAGGDRSSREGSAFGLERQIIFT